MSNTRGQKGARKLEGKVAIQIANYIRDNGLGDGGHVTEFGLAEALNISRSPVRAALEHLGELKIVSKAGPRRGFKVVASADKLQTLTEEQTSVDEEDALYQRIAEDFMTQQLAEQFSEADIVRKYGAGRRLMLRVLQRLASDRVIERNTGYGWRFVPMLRSIENHDDGYRFRLLIEPSALLEPTFVLDAAWAARVRREQETVLAMAPADVSAVRLFEANANFHEMLAASSGNHFIHQAIQIQNQARRFVNYHWTYGDEQIAAGCREHLEVLDAVEQGDNAWASALMRRHLEMASRLKP